MSDDPTCDPAEGIDWLRERLARAEKQRDDAKRYAATWKACAKSNRVGFGWWDACTDAAWSFSGTLSRVLCERFNVRIFVEPSCDAPHGGGYFTSANDRRDEIMAAIDRIEKKRDAAVSVLRTMEWGLSIQCPACAGILHLGGHRNGCALAAVLKAGA